MNGIQILNARPINPAQGDYYIDQMTYDGYMYVGTDWVQISGAGPSLPKSNEPTKEQLEKHPALKQAWDEYMVIRRLLGL